MSQNRLDMSEFNNSTLFEYWFQNQSAWFNEIIEAFKENSDKVKDLFGDTRLGESDGALTTLNIRGTARLVENGMIDFEPDPSDADGDGIADKNNIDGTLTNPADNMSYSGPILAAGKRGDDTLTGSDYDDILASNGGNDEVHAGDGNDYVKAGSGRDVVYGGEGHDLLNGDYSDSDKHNKRGGGNDIVHGEGGNDIVYGNQGDDTLTGGSGEDIVIGGNHDDRIEGNDGNDVIFGDMARGDSTDAMRKMLEGHSGIELGDDALVADVGGAGTRHGNDHIDAGRGDDVVDGDGGNDTLFGRSGDDDLDGDGGDDVIIGGTGNDSVYGDGGDDKLEGGSGNDLIDGGKGDDVLNGDVSQEEFGVGNGGGDINDPHLGADDVLIGGAGNDTIDGGAGYNIIETGDGKDEFDVVKIDLVGYGEAKGGAPRGLFETVITDFDVKDDDNGDWDTLVLQNAGAEDGYAGSNKAFDEHFLARAQELGLYDASTDGNEWALSSREDLRLLAYALESDGNSTTDAYLVGGTDLVFDFGDMRHVVLADVMSDDFSKSYLMDVDDVNAGLPAGASMGQGVEIDERADYAEFRSDEPWSRLPDDPGEMPLA